MGYGEGSVKYELSATKPYPIVRKNFGRSTFKWGVKTKWKETEGVSQNWWKI